MKALIIVDLQNDFVMGGSLAVPAGEEIIPLVNRLQDHFDLIVATQDWHPRDHGSHATNHPGRDPGDVIELAGWRQDLDAEKVFAARTRAEAHKRPARQCEPAYEIV